MLVEKSALTKGVNLVAMTALMMAAEMVLK